MYEMTFRATLTVLEQIVQLVQMGGHYLIQLNYRDSKPIYEQIKEGFRKLIISNSLSADERLPSVRELASSLAINPNTIQRAYRDLESEGYVYSIAGKGTFVAEHEGSNDIRQLELLEEFDEIVEELLFLSVAKEELKTRIDNVTEGGEQA